MTVFLDLAAYPPPTGLQIFAIFINFFFPGLALVVVVTRAAGRLATNQFGWDDWLVSVAMLLSVAETVLSYFFIKTNFIGIHIKDIPIHDPTEALIWSYAVQILYNPILSLVKSSVLIFMLRLFGQKNGVRRFIIGLNLANIAQMVGTFFAILFQCFPIAFNWDFTIKEGHCVDRRILYTCSAALNILTDLLILGLPLWIFVDLKIPRRSKIGLLFVFLLGFLVTIASVVRLVLLVQGLFGLITLVDPTFNIGFVTSGIETNLAIITASAPALRPFFRAKDRGGWFPRLSMAPSKAEDPETGQMPAGWEKEPLPVGSGVGGKFGRGGSRGGRRGGGRSGRSGRGGKKPIIRVRMDREVAELRSRSPRSSEEEAMTNDGIMRVSDIQREIDGIVKEIAVTGSGTYTGVPRPWRDDGPGSERERIPTREPTRDAAPAWPITSALTERSGDVRRYPERNYTESIYSVDTRERDYNEERISKYGDKRNALYNTPRGSRTPGRSLTRSNSSLSTRGRAQWRDTEGGRPF